MLHFTLQIETKIDLLISVGISQYLLKNTSLQGGSLTIHVHIISIQLKNGLMKPFEKKKVIVNYVLEQIDL